MLAVEVPARLLDARCVELPGGDRNPQRVLLALVAQVDAADGLARHATVLHVPTGTAPCEWLYMIHMICVDGAVCTVIQYN